MNEMGTLFLTGSTGHTGSRLTRRLLQDGWAMRCLVHTPGHQERLPQSERIEIIQGDLNQPGTWVDRVRGATAFIHTAHIGFAREVIGVCAEAGLKRIIALSSTRRFTRFPEASARRVIEGEAALTDSGLDYTILRLTMIYGGRRDNNLERVVRWLRRRRWFPLVGGGRHLVQPIFVWDLVEAVAQTLARPESTLRQALTLAGPQAITQRRMIEEMAEQMGRRIFWVPAPYWLALAAAGLLECILPNPPATRDQIRRLLEDKAYSIDAARQALGGWEPRPFEEGLRLKLAGEA